MLSRCDSTRGRYAVLRFEFRNDVLDGDLLLVHGAIWIAEILGRQRTYRYDRRFIGSRELVEPLDEVGPSLAARASALGAAPFRIVLQDCTPQPIFIECAEDKTLRSYWKVGGVFEDGAPRPHLVEMVSEKEMRRVLAEGRGVPIGAQAGPPVPDVPEETRRKFYL